VHLSANDHTLIQNLRAEGVLQNVQEHLLDQSNGVILVTCADGDRFDDIYRHQARMQSQVRRDTRIHPLTSHGGALACAPGSPIHKRKLDSNVFLNQIADARDIKKINLIALYAHMPCAAARRAELDLPTALSLQIQAKNRVRVSNPGAEVHCFFHVDYEGAKKRTYFLSSDRWKTWSSHRHVLAMA